MNEINDNLLIHLHVPKTGGTTMRSLVRRQFDRSKIKEIYPHFGMADSINQIHDMTPEEKTAINCLQGHFVYGVHVYFQRPVQYIAMLRDPVEHIISTYYYIKGDPNHPYYQELTTNNITLDNFHEWRSQYFTELNNSQTRYMAGVASRELLPEDLEAAKKNVREQFALVGLTERFDESVFLLNKTLAWNIVTYRSQNVTAVRPKQKELPHDLIQRIRENNKLDVELYNFTVELFNQKIEELEAETKLELAKFIQNRKSFDFIYDFGKSMLSEQFIDWIVNVGSCRVYLFGAGEAGKLAHNVINEMNNRLGLNIEIQAFIDNDPQKWGQYLLGTQVKGVDSIDHSIADHIVIASMYADDIEKQLLEVKIPENKIIFSLIR
ncbi:sulfotransferase family 2 domain-containing protein [Paenibacillus whitsoniae]|nr:sulfotransferase family 2 domain-containing protein [Paenibacillus whitsoniae]